MMLKSIGALVALTTAICLAQVSGTVTDSKTGSPIAGATVALKVAGTSATTDAQGRFSLAGPTGIRRGERIRGVEPVADQIRFHQGVPGRTDIRILDLAGVQRAVVHAGELPQGDWVVVPPALPQGIYTCVIEGPSGLRSVRFLASSVQRTGESVGLRPDADAPAARVAAAAVDTLIATKTGYKESRRGVESYQQTGLAVQLEDTTSAVGVDDATIVPDASWPCYMADGIPPPSSGTAVFTITLQIGAIRDVGRTKFGQRRQYDIKGGTVTGNKITATVLDGGLDYDLTLSNGSKEIEQIVILRAGSTPILMRNPGVAPAGAKDARMVLDFEAPNSSSYTWLHTGKFVATRVVDTVAKTIKMEVYDISKATLPAKRVVIKDPAGVTNQTWECLSFKGTQGAQLFTENVSLGSSISIGASKRGSRNIIPITGGTTTGRIAGKVLSGGADYQLGGLDARYTLAPNDGELIIIRNCGANGLVPVFEARIGGPYEYLNENKFMSSSPSVGGGGVSLTFYEFK